LGRRRSLFYREETRSNKRMWRATPEPKSKREKKEEMTFNREYACVRGGRATERTTS